MNSFETQCRRLIDGLVRELVAMADDLAQIEIRAARAARAKEERAKPKVSKASKPNKPSKALKVSARLQRALERGEERRRLAAERRAQKLAARAARRANGADGPAGTHTGRSRTRGVAASVTAPAPLIPPPLFVHKRSRDGSIQKLERTAEEAAATAATAAVTL